MHIFMARIRVSKSCLKAQLCFHRYVHFSCVALLYIYIYIFLYIYICICYYTLKFNMRENQILQRLTLLNSPSLILAIIENSFTWKIYTCKNHQIFIFAWLHLQNNLWILSKFNFLFSPYLIPVKYFKNWVYLQKLVLPKGFVKISSLSYYFVYIIFSYYWYGWYIYYWHKF